MFIIQETQGEEIDSLIKGFSFNNLMAIQDHLSHLILTCCRGCVNSRVHFHPARSSLTKLNTLSTMTINTLEFENKIELA